MANTKSTVVPADIEALLGAPPIMRSENRSEYDALLADYVQAWRPKGLVEWIWVRDIADCKFTICRYDRIRAVALERLIIPELERLLRGADRRKHPIDIPEFAREWFAQPKKRQLLKSDIVHAMRFEALERFAKFKEKCDAVDELIALCAAAQMRLDRAVRELTVRRNGYHERTQEERSSLIAPSDASDNSER